LGGIYAREMGQKMTNRLTDLLKTHAEKSFYQQSMMLIWVIMHAGLLIFAIPLLMKNLTLLFVWLMVTLIDINLLLSPLKETKDKTNIKES